MKRLIQIIGLLVFLAVPSAAFAQGAAGVGGQAVPGIAPAGPPGAGSYGQGAAPPIQMAQPLGHTFAAGEIRGTTVGVNLPMGIIYVRTAYNVVPLQATPAQLAGINPGDLVRFPYVDYLGNLWLSPAVGGGRAAFWGVYGNQGRFTGAIQALNKATGVIVVNGTPFRIHPALLQHFVPGELVSLMFVSVGPVNWVTTIGPTAAGGIGTR